MLKFCHSYKANLINWAASSKFGTYRYASSEGSGEPEPPLLAHTSSESRGTFRQKARSLAPLNVSACAVKICHDGMLEDTNSLDGAQLLFVLQLHQYDHYSYQESLNQFHSL